MGALLDNGGATKTMDLGGGSAAINAADPAYCASFDQRGYPRRTANGYCDIGAFEAQPHVISASNGSGQATPINLGFASPLQATVQDAYDNLLGGVIVTYTLPASGASAVLAANPAASNGSSVISTTATANGTAGAYNVTANAASGLVAANWGLTNLKGNTTTTITSSANPASPGSTVTFTVVVTSTSGGTPTGSVDFYETTTPAAVIKTAPRKALGGQSLVNGSATFTASSLGAGTHNLLATYGGDANYGASNSTLYSQLVQFNLYLKTHFPWVSR